MKSIDILSDLEIDKLLKPYFDFKFEGCKYGVIPIWQRYGYSESWVGIIKTTPERKLLMVGAPLKDRGWDYTWYATDNVFAFDYRCFSMSSFTFKAAMTRYIRKKFGEDLLFYKIL